MKNQKHEKHQGVVYEKRLFLFHQNIGKKKTSVTHIYFLFSCDTSEAQSVLKITLTSSEFILVGFS